MPGTLPTRLDGTVIPDLAVSGADLDLVTLAALGALGPQLQLAGNLEAGEVRLVDPEGAPLGILSATSAHDGVVAGTLTDARVPEHGPFARLRLPVPAIPAGLAAIVFLDGPPTVELVASVADFPVALAPLVGDGRRGRLGPDALVRSCLSVLGELVPGSIVLPLPVPAGRDDLLDAIARAYGLRRVDALAGSAGTTYAPAVQAELDRADNRGLVVLFTGLSGSGKSTLARGLRDRLVEGGSDVTLLDGDVVRRLLSRGLGFSAEDRDLNVRRIGYVAAEVARHGGLAIAAPIAPYAATRNAVREMVEEAGGTYALVHVSTPLEVCEARDRKGLYASARRGEIPSFTGVSDPYEAPTDADLTIDTSTESFENALLRLEILVKSRSRAGGTASAAASD